MDTGDATTRLCYKLTDSHVYIDKMKKMKVKLAAQVFSHRVSTALPWTAKYGRDYYLAPSAEDTADFLIFFDQLFDSANSSTREAPTGKVLKSAATPTSEHLPFWRDAVRTPKSVQFKTER